MATDGVRARAIVSIGVLIALGAVVSGCPGDTPDDGVTVVDVPLSHFSDVIRREAITEYLPAGTERRSFDVDDPDGAQSYAIADWTLEASDEATMTAAAHDFVDHAVADGWTVDAPWTPYDGESVDARLSKKNLEMRISYYPDGAAGTEPQREMGANPHLVFVWIENVIDRGFDISGN